jgi:hypothetical protein
MPSLENGFYLRLCQREEMFIEKPFFGSLFYSQTPSTFVMSLRHFPARSQFDGSRSGV